MRVCIPVVFKNTCYTELWDQRFVLKLLINEIFGYSVQLLSVKMDFELSNLGNILRLTLLILL